MSVAPFFAASYAQARERFLAHARQAGLAVKSHAHPQPGREGEPLAMDVARFGPADAKALLVVSSACHGVEGHCGTGVQNAMLADATLHAEAARRGVALLYVHGLNPWGYSWCRRTTHENVDLNRNWLDFGSALPANHAYASLHAALVPERWPPPPEAEATLAAFVERHGARALQTAISAGQGSHPDGLFFRGHRPTWSQRTLRAVLREHGARCSRLGWIDLHTGLGPSGVGERIFACRDDAKALARARAWWGSKVTSIYDGSSTSSLLNGLMFEGAYQECAQADYTGIALEYGTLPFEQVMLALRADQWLQNHPQAPEAQRQEIKRALLEAFYTDTDEWKTAIVEQGLEAAHQGIAGLGG